MFELRGAITWVWIVIGAAAALALGDYLGYKIGRWRLAIIAGSIALATFVAFVIYATVVLA
jgi:hypothetical protein